jgi:hypothetical protein
MMLDPQADPGRRVWLTCTFCNGNTPLYLLHCDVNLVWVQCGNCRADGGTIPVSATPGTRNSWTTWPDQGCMP